MDGEPVWLASVSRRNNKGRIIATGDWLPYQFDVATRIAHEKALDGIGDPNRERAFRMNITFCLHRALSVEEKERLPAKWACAAGSLAGGPVQVLWSKGIEHRPAAMPCQNPKKEIIDLKRPDLWVPVDCGKCGPCLARAEIEKRIAVVKGCF